MARAPVVLGLSRLYTLARGALEEHRWRYARNRAAVALHRSHPLPLVRRGREHARDLSRDGIAVLQMNDLSGGAGLVAELRQEMRACEERHRGEIESRRALLESGATLNEQLRTYLFGMQPWSERPTYGAALARLALHPEIVAIVNAYLRMASRIMSMSYWHTLPVAGGPQGTQRWHRDYEDVRLVKLFVHLDDVDEERGPLHYIQGTHRRLDRWRWPAATTGDRGDVDPLALYGRERERVSIGARGTVVLADTKGIHKGGLVKAGVRRLATVSYKAPSYTKKGLPSALGGLPGDIHAALRFAGS